jgi:hypothetical protein
VRVSERAWQAQVLALARYLKWRVAHFRPAQNSKGIWRTPVAADAAGFPDLVLVRERVLFVELKTDTGKLSPVQREWLRALVGDGVDARVWRPRDWDEVRETLA